MAAPHRLAARRRNPRTAKVAEAVRAGLEAEGYAVIVARDGPWVVVSQLDGRLLYRTENAPAEMTAPLSPVASRGEEFASVTRQDGKGPVRRLTAPRDVAGSATLVRVARAETRVRHELAGLMMVLLLGLPLAGVLAGVGGYLVGRRALAPVDRMNSAAADDAGTWKTDGP